MLLLCASLVIPAAVAAASPTYGITEPSPTPATVSYSDLVTFHGAHTCVDGPDASSACPTTSVTATATFALRPSGGSTFTTVATVTTSFVFASTTSSCPEACSRPFQVQWKAGRAGATSIPPGTYDVGLTSTLTTDEVILLGGLVITPEGTTTTYGGAASGDEGTALTLAATVADADRGQSAGTGIWYPDVNLGASTGVRFSLYDATNTTLVAGPVTASVSALGSLVGTPTLTLPSAGTYQLRTDYLGNTYYDPSADLDTITVNPLNTPPSLTLPGPITAEATSAAGAAVAYQVSATDAEDDPDPSPSCTPASGSTFPLGTTSVACSVTDSGGLTTTGSFSVTVVDTTSPEVTISTAEAVGSTGWYNAASNDATPGVTVDVSATDLVGVASIDCTADGVPVAGLGPTGGSFVLGDGSHDVSCTAIDGAGNAEEASASFDIDQTPPTGVSFGSTVLAGGTLVDGGSYVFGSVPDGPTGCSADFDVSGPGDCVVTGYSALVGSQTVTATATDAAGNAATAELHYTVVPWTLDGFAKPIAMTGVNVQKAGRQVTFKFQVFAGSTELTSTGVVAGITETQASCSGAGLTSSPSPAALRNDLTYATGPGTFVFSWLSPAQPGTCWVVAVTTLDGSSLAATFRLK